MSQVRTTVSNDAPAPKLDGGLLDPVFKQIRDLVYRVSGIFNTDQKLYLLAEGCGRRMKALAVHSPREYWDLLNAPRSRDTEMRNLLNEITIGETSMFRSQPQVDATRKIILPEIATHPIKQVVKRLRIWSAGCSTGEEPYTLAMTLLEESERLLKGWQFEVLATDLNERSVETAKIGIYGDYALRNTSDYYKRKYFTPMADGKFQVRDEVRRLISFSRLNLLDDAKVLFMKALDIVCCCNVLIYFDAESKSRVIEHFFSNLNPGGYLFLGTSESLLGMNEKFHLVHFPGAIGYWKPLQKGGKR